MGNKSSSKRGNKSHKFKKDSDLQDKLPATDI